MRLAVNPLSKLVEKPRKQSTIHHARPTPPPWAMLDGALLEFWRECEDCLHALSYQIQRPVPDAAIERDQGNEPRARGRQIHACSIIYRSLLNQMWELLGDYHPATLSKGHRAVRALVQDWLQTNPTDPQPDDDSDMTKPATPAAVFVSRAIRCTRQMRSVMREDAERNGKSRQDAYIRKVAAIGNELPQLEKKPLDIVVE